MDIRPAGDSAALLSFGNEISEEISFQLRLWEGRISKENFPEVREITPGYSTLLLHYDPGMILWRDLKEKLESLNLGEREAAEISLKKPLEIPVCYGGEYGQDLKFVAEYTGLSEEQVIRRHCEKQYKVYMLGFSPGFPYLGGMDPSLTTPRLETPRVKIPWGSVGIAGNQTGIYPQDSPGGWRLIGRTPLALFDPEKDQPFFLEAGDSLRFIPINEKLYQKILEEEGRQP